MDAAIAYQIEHPETPLSQVSDRFNVPKSTLHDRLTGTHVPRGVRTVRNLSIAEEGVLVNKINKYADRRTLFEPRHVKELAEKLCKQQVGRNWVLTFFQRHVSLGYVNQQRLGIQLAIFG